MDSSEAIAHLLERAWILPDLLMEVAAAGKTTHVESDDFPGSTALRLQHLANMQFHAGLALLADERTSSAVELVLRALAELFAHAWFIFADSDQAKWRCHAICLELGMARSLDDIAKAFAGTTTFGDTDRLAKEAAYRVKFLTDLRSNENCRCHERSFRDVQPTLRRISSAIPELDWVHPLWKVSSVVAHQFSADRVLHDLGDGTNAVVGMSRQERVARCAQLLALFMNMARLFLLFVEQPQTERFEQAVIELQGLPAFVAMRHNDDEPSSL